MKKKLGRLWQEIAKVLRWILRNRSLLKTVLRLGVLLYKLIGYVEGK